MLMDQGCFYTRFSFGLGKNFEWVELNTPSDATSILFRRTGHT
jgi:hypothetical protein